MVEKGQKRSREAAAVSPRGAGVKSLAPRETPAAGDLKKKKKPSAPSLTTGPSEQKDRLPVHFARREICAAFAAHETLLLVGETGSGQRPRAVFDFDRVVEMSVETRTIDELKRTRVVRGFPGHSIDRPNRRLETPDLRYESRTKRESKLSLGAGSGKSTQLVQFLLAERRVDRQRAEK